MNLKEKRIYLYFDERMEEGKDILSLLTEANIIFTTIAVSGSIMELQVNGIRIIGYRAIKEYIKENELPKV